MGGFAPSVLIPSAVYLTVEDRARLRGQAGVEPSRKAPSGRDDIEHHGLLAQRFVPRWPAVDVRLRIIEADEVVNGAAHLISTAGSRSDPTRAVRRKLVHRPLDLRHSSMRHRCSPTNNRRAP